MDNNSGLNVLGIIPLEEVGSSTDHHSQGWMKNPRVAGPVNAAVDSTQNTGGQHH